MKWFTVEDVSRGADVFLTWYNRVAPTPGTYANDFLNILKNQKDTFVNIVSRMLNLQHEEAVADGTFAAPSPLTFAEMEKVMPGITKADVKDLTDAQCRALLATCKCCQVPAK